MRLTEKDVEKRLRAIESVKGASQKLRETVENLDISPHIADCYGEIHEDICEGGHEFYNLPGGRGSGKSSFIALEIVNQIMKDGSHMSNALVIRKWAVTLRGSVFAQIQWAIDVLGVSEYWRSTVQPMQYIFETGQTIRLSGLDDPTKLKSLKPIRGYFRFLWIEEFSELTGEPELRSLQQSVLRGGDRFVSFRSFNPPISTANWTNQFVERPDKKSLTFRTDYRMIPVTWLGQPFVDEAERLREVNERAYQHEYLGLPVGSGSEVFPNLEIRRIEDEEIQRQQYVYCGVDFGFASDPACCVRVGYDRRTETILFMNELYQTHLSNEALATLITEKGLNKWDNAPSYFSPIYRTYYREEMTVICDSAEPKSIADLRNMGIKCRKCHKEPGCVQYRVKWLQHRKIVIDPERTPESAREFRNYSYKIDKGTGAITSELPDRDNHSIDAVAYALNDEIYDSDKSA